ncbi:uncharacterized protein LOC112348162 [Selaginella moellendorffii]|uniref:uncharacterized protein LOC112348162 n=1 Tax=Selaginella moellendorffii TaxID=88036 RepID=UPI000D1C70A1|nr:uncharacterized protein LOC112348162 [Selaginella moellendorffii]|eukprot:XP_024536026.1 uncharacterized protein LOC112348162 [Selaginella moellendorffii]
MVNKLSGVDRVRAHLLGEGPGSKDIVSCPLIPGNKKADLLNMQKVIDSEKGARGKKRPNESGGASMRMDGNVQGFPPVVSSQSSGSGCSSLFFSKQSQVHIVDSMDLERKNRVDVAIGRFFWNEHIPFVKARSPYFLNMIQEVARHGVPYAPPKYDDLRDKLLVKEKRFIDIEMASLRKQWEQRGATICTDGWADRRNRHIMGLVAYSQGRGAFLKAIDISLTGKTAENTLRCWEEGINIVGAENVVMVVTDGENANRAAAALLQQRYPKIQWAACFAHCLNNALKDFGVLPWMATLLERGKSLVIFVRNHSHILALLVEFTHKRLLRYCDTRFGYNFIMMERLVELREALQQMFVCPAYRARPESKSRAGRDSYATVFDDSFWQQVKDMLEVSKDVMLLLRVVDGDIPAIGKIYECMNRLDASLEEGQSDYGRYRELHQIMSNRWHEYHSLMHSVAYMLDPEFQEYEKHANREVMKDWNAYLLAMFTSSERDVIRDELLTYRRIGGIFNSYDAKADHTKRGAVRWWEDYGYETPALQKLAIRVLSQACSSSSVERLFSTFEHVSSKKRNRLTMDRTADLVFVACNTRLLTCKNDRDYDKFVSYKVLETVPHPEDELESGQEEEDGDDVEDREVKDHEVEDDDEMQDI